MATDKDTDTGEIEIKLNLEDTDLSNISDKSDDISEDEELENEARTMGWRPEEEWEGPKSKWRSAKEFVDRSSFFKKIDRQNQIISEQNAALKQLATLQKNLAKAEREKVLKELNLQKRAAWEEQDFEAASQIDDQIIAVKTAPEPEFNIPDPEQVADPGNQEFESFKNRNSWYGQDPDLTDLAETLAGGYAVKMQRLNKGVDPAELFKYIEQQIVKYKKSAPKADPVEGVKRTSGPASTGKKSKYTQNDLSSEQLKFAKRFVELGAFGTVQEYVDSLASIGELN